MYFQGLLPFYLVVQRQVLLLCTLSIIYNCLLVDVCIYVFDYQLY